MIATVTAFVYPTLAAISLVVAGLVFVFHANVYRTRLVKLVGVYTILNFVAFGILSLITGVKPLVNPEPLNGWLTLVRILMIVVLTMYARELWKRSRY